jgi:mannobiose 2-epimerase
MIRVMHLLKDIDIFWKRQQYNWNVKREFHPALPRVNRPSSFSQAQEILERIFTHNITPFWYPGVIDKDDGGYRLNHDRRGQWKGKANKSLVTQARMLWYFSRLANSNYRTQAYLDAAHHGYDFLFTAMWDNDDGGFYWEVNSEGTATSKSYKHVYGQAFALYALTEYAKASGQQSALTLAKQLFGLLETHAYDSEHGGYKETFGSNWKDSPALSKEDWHIQDPSAKTFNTHLHLLEAITQYYRFTLDEKARDRIWELIFVLSNTVLRKQVGVCTDQFHRDWTPLRGPKHDRVSYGHDLESIWILAEAYQTLGISNSLNMDFYQTLFFYALRYGYDSQYGGFYTEGYFNAPADKREKFWWVQAEAILSALHVPPDRPRTLCQLFLSNVELD